MISLICGIKKEKTGNRLVVIRGWRRWVGEMNEGGQTVQLPVIK